MNTRKKMIKLSVDEYRNIIIGNTNTRCKGNNTDESKIKIHCGFRLINNNVNQNFKLKD